MLKSIPVIPAQPNQPSYSPDALRLFKRYDRASYLAEFGIQAPAFDPSRLIKTWFDTSVDTSDPENMASYRYINDAGKWKQLNIPASVASEVNLPGVVTYDAYTITPNSQARDGAGVLLRPQEMSTHQQGVDLLAELGLSPVPALVDAGAPTSSLPVEYGSDPRRLWVFTFGGQTWNVQSLLIEKNAQGVGYPGKWVVTDSTITWGNVPVGPTGLDDQRPPVPMPLRDLLPNEQISSVSLDAVAIVRTDLAPTNGTPGNSQLDYIEGLLQRIAAKVGA